MKVTPPRLTKGQYGDRCEPKASALEVQSPLGFTTRDLAATLCLAASTHLTQWTLYYLLLTILQLLAAADITLDGYKGSLGSEWSWPW